MKLYTTHQAPRNTNKEKPRPPGTKNKERGRETHVPKTASQTQTSQLDHQVQKHGDTVKRALFSTVLASELQCLAALGHHSLTSRAVGLDGEQRLEKHLD